MFATLNSKLPTRVIATLLISSLSVSCGSRLRTDSGYVSPTAVHGAVVTVTDSLRVSGPIVDEDASSITIVVYGATHRYDKARVVAIDRMMIDDPDETLKDIASNTRTTSTIMLIYLTLTIASVVYVATQQ